MTAARLLREELDERPAMDLVPYVITNTAPLTVRLAGRPNTQPAIGLAGDIHAVDEKGYALYKPPLLPILLKTN